MGFGDDSKFDQSLPRQGSADIEIIDGGDFVDEYLANKAKDRSAGT